MMRTTHWAPLLGLLTFVLGCGDQAKQSDQQMPTPPADTAASAKEEHSHGEGPNGGAVADWGGGKYHVEFTVNHDAQSAIVFVLGSDAKSPEPVSSETILLSINDPSFQVDLMPAPLDGEAEGTSSRFVGKHEGLGNVQEFAGTISGEVDGTPYAGDFTEEPHGH